MGKEFELKVDGSGITKSIIKGQGKIKGGICNIKKKIDAACVGQAKRVNKKKKIGVPQPMSITDKNWTEIDKAVLDEGGDECKASPGTGGL